MSKASVKNAGRIATVQVSKFISAQGTYCGQDKEGRHRVQVGEVIHKGQLVGPPSHAADITAG